MALADAALWPQKATHPVLLRSSLDEYNKPEIFSNMCCNRGCVWGFWPDNTQRKPPTFSTQNVTYLRGLLICPHVFSSSSNLTVNTVMKGISQVWEFHTPMLHCVWGLLHSHCWPFQGDKYTVISCTDKWCRPGVTSWLHCQILVTEHRTGVVCSKNMHHHRSWPFAITVDFLKICVISSALKTRWC